MTGMQAITKAQRETGGFIRDTDLPAIAADPLTRLTPLLVRCGGGRFMAPAQDVAHFIDIIAADGRDYVRDVSLATKGAIGAIP